MDEDPAFYEKFSKLIQQAIDAFKACRLSALDYLKEPLINYLRCYCCVKNQLKMLIIYRNRKSLEIVVHPDKCVVVKAPKTSTLETIEKNQEKSALNKAPNCLFQPIRPKNA